MAITQTTHRLIQQHLSDNPDMDKQFAVDATCGNGHDTLFLCETGFKTIYAFDIQEQAIIQTQERTRHFNNVEFINAGHEEMQNHVLHKVDIIMFNLGYLPNANKDITTLTGTSLLAVEQAVTLLSAQGLLTIICYPGHENGKLESQKINDWADEQAQEYCIRKYLSDTPSPQAPFLLTLCKL